MRKRLHWDYETAGLFADEGIGLALPITPKPVEPSVRLGEALRQLRAGDEEDRAIAEKLATSAAENARCEAHGQMHDPWCALDQHGRLLFICRLCNPTRNGIPIKAPDAP